jgi:hypothetical protein
VKYIITAAVIFTICLFIITAPPTIYPGDGGELAAAAFTLGIGHPPGYPLFIMSEKILSLIPCGDIAFRMNLLPVLFAVVFLIMFYSVVLYAVRKINTGRDMPGVDIAVFAVLCVLVFSRLFWFESIQIKGGIYMLEYLILAAAFYSALKFSYEKEDRYFFAGIYMAGFLPVAHHTGTLAMIFLTVWLLRAAGKRNFRFYASGLALFLLAFLTPYLYLFIRAETAAVRWADISSPAEVLRHIFRSVYFTDDSPPFGMTAVFLKIKDYLVNLAMNYNVIIVPAVYGMYITQKAAPRMFKHLSIFFLMYFAGTAYFTSNNPSLLYTDTNEVFYIVNDILIFFFAASGAAASIAHIKNTKAATAAAAMLFCIPVVFVFVNFDRNNKSRHFIAYDHSENICKTIEPDGILFDKSDEAVFGLQYMKKVKNKYGALGLFDSNGNVLDVSYLKWIRTQSGFTREAQQGEEIRMAKDRPGKVYYLEGIGYPDRKLLNRQYGMLYRLSDENTLAINAEKLMQLCSIRDFFITKNRDLTCRNMLARYFTSTAEYAAFGGDIPRFEFYRAAAVKEAGDYANVYKKIASIYYHAFADGKNCMMNLEKSVSLEPYDFGVINLIIQIYRDLNMWDKAAEWCEYYYRKEWDYKRKAGIRKEADSIRDKYKVQLQDSGLKTQIENRIQ